jgi:hypothetical protein
VSLARYDRFEHIRRALILKRDRLMVTFSAYFDDGGTPDEGKFLFVAGFISTVGEWSRFNRRWWKHLDDYGIRDFHMKDFAQSKGQFEKWKGKELKRKKFLNGLIREIVMHAACGFSSGVDLSAWQTANAKYMLRESNITPYSLSGCDCVEASLDWCGKTVPEYVRMKLFPRSWLTPAKKKQVLFVFDQGSKHWGTLLNRLRREYGIVPIPGKREDLPALQAADLYAYEHRIKMRNWASGLSGFADASPRVPLTLISQHLHGESRRQHMHTLEHLCATVPPRRRRIS